MNTIEKEIRRAKSESQNQARRDVEDRTIWMGLLVIFTLAFLALGLRYLLPNLNSYVLLGLGAAVYLTYIGSWLLARLGESNKDEAKVKPAIVIARDNRPQDDWGQEK